MRSIIFASAVAIASLVTVAPASAEGFRAELHTGWDHVGTDGSHADGVLYGVGIGYDAKVGEKLLVGIEADLDDSSAKDCITTGTGAATTRTCVNTDRDIAVVGRLGYKVSEQGTLYALAGYTNARFEAAARTGTTTVRSGDNLDGVRLGLGYEHNFSSNLYAKAEYRYSNYEQGLDRHQLVTGIGIRF